MPHSVVFQVRIEILGPVARRMAEVFVKAARDREDTKRRKASVRVFPAFLGSS
jgi:hypothetical protein